VPDRLLLRCGAVAAVAGALAQLVATLLEPNVSSDPHRAVRTVAQSGVWQWSRAIDLIGALLTVGGLAVAGRTITRPPGRTWASTGEPFLILMGAIGIGAVLTGADMKNMADAWSSAAPTMKSSYVAAYDSASNLKDDLFFGAFLALSLYAASLATAILRSDSPFPRWNGWTLLASAALILTSNFSLLVVDAAFVGLLLGFLLFLLVVVAIGTSMWRGSSRRGWGEPSANP